MLLNLVWFIGGAFSMMLFIGIGRDLLIRKSKLLFTIELYILLITIICFMVGTLGVMLLVIFTLIIKEYSESTPELLEAFNILPELKHLLKK